MSCVRLAMRVGAGTLIISGCFEGGLRPAAPLITTIAVPAAAAVVIFAGHCLQKLGVWVGSDRLEHDIQIAGDAKPRRKAQPRVERDRDSGGLPSDHRGEARRR